MKNPEEGSELERLRSELSEARKEISEKSAALAALETTYAHSLAQAQRGVKVLRRQLEATEAQVLELHEWQATAAIHEAALKRAQEALAGLERATAACAKATPNPALRDVLERAARAAREVLPRPAKVSAC